MAKKNSSNNDFLYKAKDSTSHKIYPLLVELVNEDREELAEQVTKIDYLLEYTSTCIKQKDFREARDTIKRVEDRLNILKKEKVDMGYLEYLYEGIKNKIK
ncbi:hypothetical protein [Clostridium sp. LP20]|uniref:hypothetical protein n=1 Tax=Clostridium sp. LP20 TaxID=3418665 RepID=UPI003EE77A8E